MKTALTIAGSDSSGGAGIQADIKTMSALGVYGMSVITSIVAENTCRVISVYDVPTETIEDQIDAVFQDIFVDAIKIGMISSREIIEAVSEKLKQYKPQNIVIDPVMYSKDGTALLKEDAIDVFIKKLLSLSTLITPNIPEAERISGKKIDTLRDVKEAAQLITAMGAKNVLIKGGHFEGDATDVLYDGKSYREFSHSRVAKTPHGTGCTLSSAIASFLARGLSLPEAVENAKEYVTGAITNALEQGKGNGPTHHFYRFYDTDGELL